MQSGEIIRPSHQARQRGGPHQVGRPDTQGRPGRHGRDRADVGQAGLRPVRQPAQLRQPGRFRRGQHAADTRPALAVGEESKQPQPAGGRCRGDGHEHCSVTSVDTVTRRNVNRRLSLASDDQPYNMTNSVGFVTTE